MGFISFTCVWKGETFSPKLALKIFCQLIFTIQHLAHMGTLNFTKSKQKVCKQWSVKQKCSVFQDFIRVWCLEIKMGTLKVARHEKFPTEEVYSLMSINADLVFICQHGQKIFANRALLCGQSKLLSEHLLRDHVQGQGQAYYVTLADVEACDVNRALELLTTGTTHLKDEVMEVLDLLGVDIDKTTFQVYWDPTIAAENARKDLTIESGNDILSSDSHDNSPLRKKLKRGMSNGSEIGGVEVMEQNQDKMHFRARGKPNQFTDNDLHDSVLSSKKESENSCGNFPSPVMCSKFKTNIQAKQLPDFDPCTEYQTLNDIPHDELEAMMDKTGNCGSRDRIVQFVRTVQMYRRHQSTRPKICPYCPFLFHSKRSINNIIRHLATHFKKEILDTVPHKKLQDPRKCWKCKKDLREGKENLPTHLALLHNALQIEGIMPPLLRNFDFSVGEFRQ